MKKTYSILWGLILIAAGTLFALNALNLTNIDVFFDGWWTLFIIIPCAVDFFSGKDRTGSLIGIAIGVFLLLCCQDLMDFDMLWKLALPAIIILIGVKMLLNGIFDSKGNEVFSRMKASGERIPVCCAAFSGQTMNYDNEVFQGAELTATFGSVTCDLRNAIFEQDCAIHVCALFGGIDILLPPTVNVKINSNSLFGGISNKHGPNSTQNAVTVYISGSCIFGGTDIK